MNREGRVLRLVRFRCRWGFKMKRFLVLVLVSVLMFGLVAGAGYKITTPSSSTSSSGGGGGGGGGTTTNATTNDTVDDSVSKDEGKEDKGIVDSVSDGVDKVVESVKGLGWMTVVIILVVLAIIGGVAWNVLKDKRKKFVEIKTKKK